MERARGEKRMEGGEGKEGEGERNFGEGVCAIGFRRIDTPAMPTSKSKV